MCYVSSSAKFSVLLLLLVMIYGVIMSKFLKLHCDVYCQADGSLNWRCHHFGLFLLGVIWPVFIFNVLRIVFVFMVLSLLCSYIFVISLWFLVLSQDDDIRFWLKNKKYYAVQLRGL